MAKKLHLLPSLTCFSFRMTRKSSPLYVSKLFASEFVTDVKDQIREHNEKKQLENLQMHVPEGRPDSPFEQIVDCGIRPGVFPYNKVAQSEVKLSKNTNRGLDLMENGSRRPDLFPYDLVISRLCYERKIEEATKLLEEMLAMKVKPKRSSYMRLVYAYSKIDKFEEAKGILKQVHNVGVLPNPESFTFLLESLCREDRMEEADGLLKEMEAAGIVPRMLSYRFLFDGHMRRGNLDGVVALFKEVATKRVKFSAYTCDMLLMRLFTVGRASEIETVWKHLCLDGVAYTISIYMILVDVFPRVGGESKSLSWMEQMEKYGFKPDSITYNRLIRSLSKVQNISRVEELVRLMSNRGLAPDLQTYNILIDGYGQDEQFDKCFQILEEMEQKGLEPNEIIYDSLINCLCKKGKLTDALRLLDKMTKAGISPSPVTYNSVINRSCKVGQVSKAEELAQKLQSQGDEVKAGDPAKIEIEDSRILHLSQDIVEARDESTGDDGSSDEEDEPTLKNEKKTKKSPAESGTKTSGSEKMANLVAPKSGGDGKKGFDLTATRHPLMQCGKPNASAD